MMFNLFFVILIAEDSYFISEMKELFAYALCCELVKDYDAQKSTQSMDCFSLAIQV